MQMNMLASAYVVIDGAFELRALRVVIPSLIDLARNRLRVCERPGADVQGTAGSGPMNAGIARTKAARDDDLAGVSLVEPQEQGD